MDENKPILDHHSFPYRLYQMSKKDGIWDPESLDFTQDRLDWVKMSEADQRVILELVSMFYTGEQSVTSELIPLIHALSMDGQLEETMYLTAFLFEEAKHAEFFFLFMKEVIQTNVDLHSYHSTTFQHFFEIELPQTMQRLLSDPSPENLAIASTTYHLVTEDIIGSTSFRNFHQRYGKHGIMPGLAKGFRLIAQDEGRHISFGTHLIQRLIREHGDQILEVVKKRQAELYPFCTKVVGANFSHLVKQRMNNRLTILNKACSKDLQ